MKVLAKRGKDRRQTQERMAAAEAVAEAGDGAMV